MSLQFQLDQVLALAEYVEKLRSAVDTCDMLGGARQSLRKKIADELAALIGKEA